MNGDGIDEVVLFDRFFSGPSTVFSFDPLTQSWQASDILPTTDVGRYAFARFDQEPSPHLVCWGESLQLFRSSEAAAPGGTDWRAADHRALPDDIQWVALAPGGLFLIRTNTDQSSVCRWKSIRRDGAALEFAELGGKVIDVISPAHRPSFADPATLVRVDDTAVLVIPDDFAPSGCQLVRFRTALPRIPQVTHPPMVTGAVFATGRTYEVVMFTEGWIMTATVEDGKITDEVVVVHDQPDRGRETLPTPRQFLAAGLVFTSPGLQNVEVLALQGAEAGESSYIFARDRRVTGVFGAIDVDQQYWLVTFRCNEDQAEAHGIALDRCSSIEIISVDEFLIVERR